MLSIVLEVLILPFNKGLSVLIVSWRWVFYLFYLLYQTYISELTMSFSWKQNSATKEKISVPWLWTFCVYKASFQQRLNTEYIPVYQNPYVIPFHDLFDRGLLLTRTPLYQDSKLWSWIISFLIISRDRTNMSQLS